MKMTRVSIGLFFSASVCFVLFAMSDNTVAEKVIPSKGSGTAIIMTGAAARIPQQVALLEELYNRGLMKDVVFISGVSAGALNAVVLNGILSGEMTWDEYKNILFSLKNSDVFIPQEGKKLPVDTEPIRNLLKRIVDDDLGYHTIGDLPIMTEISFASPRDHTLKRNVYRMCSRKINSETDTTLNLIDIMMASSAVPFAFPPVRISNVKTIPDVEYIDGGVGSDYVPFKALLEFQAFRGERVNKVFIISRKIASLAEISEELNLLGVENKGRLDKVMPSFDYLIRRHMMNRLEAFAKEAPELIYSSFVWIPDFEQDYLMFNFSNLEEQYVITREWAANNDPVSLGDYLLYNKLKKKKS
jgi:predicted acylesterase/phospholipase RssA